jgi:hypothetical protein
VWPSTPKPDGKLPQPECVGAGRDVALDFAVLWSKFTAARSTDLFSTGFSGQPNVITKALWSMRFRYTSSKPSDRHSDSEHQSAVARNGTPPWRFGIRDYGNTAYDRS